MENGNGGIRHVEIRQLLPIVSLWLSLRVYTSLGAALFSSLRPITPVELSMPIWPPAADLGLWLYRLLLAPWLRWDAVWFRAILVDGMIANNGSTAFFPLYPLLSKPLYWLGADPLLSLMITSTLAALGSFWIFYRFAGLDLRRDDCLLALILLATFPVALILFAPYRESVFLFFSVLALYEIRRRHWLVAALAAFAASLTRQQGVLLVLPMLWQAWEDSGRSVRGVLKAWRGWAAALSAPAGLLLWTAFRIGYLHEESLDTRTWQGFVYSAILSTSAKATAPDQAIVWPWDAFALVPPRLMHGPDIEDVMAVGLGIAFVVLLALAWRHMQPGDRLYCLAITLVSFSYSSGAGRVYAALPRHLLLAAPVFVGLAAALPNRWQRYSVVGVQLLLQLFMLFLYVTKAWIP
jgi:hypothetical protein